MSSFIKARVLQDAQRGMYDVDASVKNGMEVEGELCLPAMKEEASELLANTSRTGKCDINPSCHMWKVRFCDIRRKDNAIFATAPIMGRPLTLIDYGDTRNAWGSY